MKVTGETITLGQIRELFRASTDADVVRACVTAVGDGVTGVRFLLGNASDYEVTRAHERCAAAFNALHGATP